MYISGVPDITENTDEEVSPEPEQEPEDDREHQLEAWIPLSNILEELQGDEYKLMIVEMGARVKEDYDIDVVSREEWFKRYEISIELAGLIIKEKSSPWPGASNIVLPLVSQACLQFGARALPNIIKNKQVVKGKVIGPRTEEKKKRAERIGNHMSYQITEVMDGWEQDMDKLLHVLPLVGTIHKKTYYNPVDRVNVSEYISPRDCVINYYAKANPQRITHPYELYPNEIEEEIRSGKFIDFEYGTALITGDNKHVSVSDEDAPHRFLEQHRWWDLDGDGYKEPYIVTVHEGTEKVVRISARYDINGITRDEKKNIIKIKPVKYFTKFGFIPSFDDSYYDLGYGILLGEHNEAVNGIINRLLDAGTLQNTPSGFISSMVSGIKQRLGGILKFLPGEWKIVNHSGVDLKAGVFPLPTPTPSPVLMEMLGVLIEAAKELSSSSDLLAGKQPNANQPATTTIAMIEQGLKVYVAAYGRIHGSLTEEFRKLKRLNRLYLDNESYYNVNDTDQFMPRDDYEDDKCDVVPVSSPEDIADPKKLAIAEALLAFVNDPELNTKEIKRRYFDRIGEVDVDGLFNIEEDRPPDPAVIAEQAKIEIEQGKLQIEQTKIAIEERRIVIDEQKAPYEIQKLRADSIKALADAESKEAGQQLDEYKVKFDTDLAALNAQKEQDEVKDEKENR